MANPTNGNVGPLIFVAGAGVVVGVVGDAGVRVAAVGEGGQDGVQLEAVQVQGAVVVDVWERASPGL